MRNSLDPIACFKEIAKLGGAGLSTKLLAADTFATHWAGDADFVKGDGDALGHDLVSLYLSASVCKIPSQTMAVNRKIQKFRKFF